MTTTRLLAVVGIATAMVASAGRALACGHVAMAAPMVGPMAAPMATAMVGPMAVAAIPQIGFTVAALPVGAISVVVDGAPFFRMGPTWYAPFQAQTGMMYRVVPAPQGM